MKGRFSKNEWEALEKVADEIGGSDGIDRDLLLAELAAKNDAERKSTIAAYRTLAINGWEKELVLNAENAGAIIHH